MTLREDIRAALPELELIEDEALADAVVEAWAIAMTENGHEDIHALRWFEPYQTRLGLDDEYLVDHVRDVTNAARALATSLNETRDAGVDLDVVTAGGLVHDVSHTAEFDGAEWTPVGELLGHPHYGVYVARAAGLPVEVEHIVLSHPPSTSTAPATLEAEVVAGVDKTVASAIKARSYENLLDAPSAGRYD